MWQMKNEKKNPCQRQLSKSAESYGSEVYFERKKNYKDEIQIKFLQGENRTWCILKGDKTLLTQNNNNNSSV